MAKTKKSNHVKKITKYGGTNTNMGPPAPKYPPKKLARLPDLQSSEEYFLQVTGHDKDVVDGLLNISKTKPKKQSKKIYKTSRRFKPSEKTLKNFEMPPDNTKLSGGLAVARLGPNGLKIRKRNHPRPPLLETTRVDGVKASLHDGTRRYAPSGPPGSRRPSSSRFPRASSGAARRWSRGCRSGRTSP